MNFLMKMAESVNEWFNKTFFREHWEFMQEYGEMIERYRQTRFQPGGGSSYGGDEYEENAERGEWGRSDSGYRSSLFDDDFHNQAGGLFDSTAGNPCQNDVIMSPVYSSVEGNIFHGMSSCAHGHDW